jgi:hypothetical protein
MVLQLCKEQQVARTTTKLWIYMHAWHAGAARAVCKPVDNSPPAVCDDWSLMYEGQKPIIELCNMHFETI